MPKLRRVYIYIYIYIISLQGLSHLHLIIIKLMEEIDSTLALSVSYNRILTGVGEGVYIKAGGKTSASLPFGMRARDGSVSQTPAMLPCSIV